MRRAKSLCDQEIRSLTSLLRPGDIEGENDKEGQEEEAGAHVEKRIEKRGGFPEAESCDQASLNGLNQLWIWASIRKNCLAKRTSSVIKQVELRWFAGAVT
jgi:hypothetical protein